MNEYNLRIELKSDLHIGSGFGFSRIIDHLSIKNADGVAYIPGSTIKGKLRSVCKKIALTLKEQPYPNQENQICQSLESQEMCKHDDETDRCIICRLFGSPFAEGKLIFTDAKLPDTKKDEIIALSKIKISPIVEGQSILKTGVKLSRARRIADPKHLFTLESVSRTLPFAGKILMRQTSQPLTEDEERLLEYGFRVLTHLGGQKSRGLGRVKIKFGLSDSEVDSQ